MNLSDLVYRLSHPGDSDDARAALLLFIAAAASLGLVAFTDRADMTTATLILSGFACFIAGLFLLTFHRGAAVSPEIAGLLDPGARIALARVAADLGVDGDAAILPRRDGDPLQFTSSGLSVLPEGDIITSLCIQEGSVGLCVPPLSLPLRHHLRDEYGLGTPDGVASALSAYKEAIIVCLELADEVHATVEGEDPVIGIVGFTLFDGCRIVAAESPKCCTMFPCAICGLAGLLLAEATGKPWIYDQITMNPEDRSVRIVLRSP
ncbi:hypothetical protein RJ53_04725 [Methanocalculus chunghsingensis]|uniref:Uncharacterized protein n=1 Tax=Methanocalculus chunghsingensis TaxID=156457 RepID=A0A8J7W9G9_9EURY|nr:hypothetical protein [Methanocalculus chunghsingensis]MBR1368852.1 hypothetical protein [Methanocalculus chunghsingensis]